MALIDKASLLMVPSTYEDGTLYNVLPSGNKAPDETGNHNGYDQTRADFTFSRGSNLAATRVNADGLIEKGRENLLFPSENTNTGWSAGGTNTYTSNIQTTQQDPNGSTRGFRWTATIGSTLNDRAFYRKNYTKDGSYLTLSFWVKSANGSNQTLTFHYSGGHRSTINVTNEWQRVEYGETNGVGIGYFGIEIRGTISDESADVYLYGWQLEKSLVATDYIETGATTATAGVLENTPRIDYSSGAGAFLLEPQRTNLLPHSEYLGVSDWVKLGAGTGSVPTITTNYATSPEGVQNATRVQLDLNGGTSSSDQSLFYEDLGAGTGDFTRSIYIKSNSGEVDLYFGGTLSDYETITVTEEWKRFDVTSTLSSQTRYFSLGLRGTTGSSDVADILVYACQYEAGSHVSSYVPTYGSAATRGADACSVTGASDVIGQSEGTLFVEADLTDVDSSTTRGIAELNDGGTLSRITLFRNSNGTIRLFVRNGGTAQMDETYLTPPSGVTKIGIGYTSNDIVLYVNGTQVASDTSATIPACSVFDLGVMEGNLTKALGDGVKQAIVFPTRLTNEELATLTTL